MTTAEERYEKTWNSFLALVNQPVNVLTGIAREAQVFFTLLQVVNYHPCRPVASVHPVQPLVVVKDECRAEQQHQRVGDVLTS